MTSDKTDLEQKLKKVQEMAQDAGTHQKALAELKEDIEKLNTEIIRKDK